MRPLARSVAGSIATLAVAFAATSVAFACPIGGHDCLPTKKSWHASHWRGGLDVGQSVRLGIMNAEVLNAVLGKYPYRTYGYNNGTCIGYRVICDEDGRVIGEEPIVTC